VLNERPDVAPATREAVQRAVQEQGFTSNRTARSPSAGRTFTVCVTLPLVEVGYFTQILGGTAEALYEQDMQVVLATTLHLHERSATLLDRLAHGTDGAVLITAAQTNDELKALASVGYPLVVVDPVEPLD
jgi:LacI family transcriptional regulator